MKFVRLVPCCTITTQQDQIIRVLLGQNAFIVEHTPLRVKNDIKETEPAAYAVGSGVIWGGPRSPAGQFPLAGAGLVGGLADDQFDIELVFTRKRLPVRAAGKSGRHAAHLQRRRDRKSTRLNSSHSTSSRMPSSA